MNILLIPVLLFPVATVLMLLHFKKQYQNAADEAEQLKLKKKLTIAIVVNVIAFVLLAIVIAGFAYLVFALKFRT